MMGVLLVPSSWPTLSPISDGLDVNVTLNITWVHLNHDMVPRQLYKLSFYGGHSITISLYYNCFSFNQKNIIRSISYWRLFEYYYSSSSSSSYCCCHRQNLIRKTCMPPFQFTTTAAVAVRKIMYANATVAVVELRLFRGRLHTYCFQQIGYCYRHVP